MWPTVEYLTATLRMRDEEAERLGLLAEVRRLAGRDGPRRLWRWRIEPGMEEAFRDLLGWFLSSQRDAPLESAAAARVDTAPPPRVATSKPLPDSGRAWGGFCAPACCPRPH